MYFRTQMQLISKRIKLFLFLFIVEMTTIFYCHHIFPQQVILQNYSSEDGLIANPVHHIFQDKNGFLWFSTAYGVSQYNGFRFVNYNKQNGLSSNWVNAVFEDEKGIIQVVLGNNQIATIHQGKIKVKSLKKQVYINTVFDTEESGILATTSGNGIVKIVDQKVEQVTDPIEDYSSTFVRTADGKYVVGGNYYHNGEYITSLYLLDKNGKVLTRAKPGQPNLVFQLFTDLQSRIWVATINGLYLLSTNDLQKNQLKLLPPYPPFNSPLLQGEVINMIQDRAGNYWIGTTAYGLIKITPEGKLIQINLRNGLASNKVSSLLQDREGNIWVGTLKGVTKIVLGGHIKYFTKENGLKDSDIQSVLTKNDNEVYFTTVNGYLQKINSKLFKITTLASKEDGFFRFFSTRSGNTFVGYSTNRWFGKELYRFDETNGLGEKMLSFSHAFFTVEEDQYNNLYFGSSQGLYIVNAVTGGIQILANITERVNHILIDKNGNLWVSLFNGKLFRLQMSYNHNTATAVKKEMTYLLAGGRAKHCFQDSKGQIWVGTRNQGLVLLSPQKDYKQPEYYTQKNGLMSFSCRVLSEDQQGSLFVVSQLGIDKLIPLQSGDYKVFNFSEENRFYDEIWSVSRTEKDNLWLATSSGLVKMNDYKTDTLAPPPIYITQVMNHNNEEITYKKEHTFLYNQNSLHFEFSSPSFINEHALQYSYRLLGGTDKNWSKPASIHRVSYSDLRPGEYRFEVKSLRKNNKKGSIDAYEFKIKPPWWKTWWFYLLLLLLTAAIVTYFVQKHINQIRFEAKMKQKIFETEMMALRAQMNPHFIFNCINNIDALVQGNNRYDATKYLNKFAKLLRNVLDSSKMNLVPLSKDLETLQLYMDLEQLRDKGKYSVSMNVEDSLLHKDYSVPPLIVQPFVENAILHGLRKKQGHDGKLTVTVSEQFPYIKYVIKDNGVGRQYTEAQKLVNKNSYGTQISEDRVKHFNEEEKASITITDLKRNGKAGGTIVEVLLRVE